MGLGTVTCTLGNPFCSLDRKGQCKCGQKQEEVSGRCSWAHVCSWLLSSTLKEGGGDKHLGGELVLWMEGLLGPKHSPSLPILFCPPHS